MPSPSLPLTEQEQTEIIAARHQGVKVAELADKYDKSKNAIYLVLRGELGKRRKLTASTRELRFILRDIERNAKPDGDPDPRAAIAALMVQPLSYTPMWKVAVLALEACVAMEMARKAGTPVVPKEMYAGLETVCQPRHGGKIHREGFYPPAEIVQPRGC